MSDTVEKPVPCLDRAQKLIEMGFPIILRGVVGMGHVGWGNPHGEDAMRFLTALRNPNITQSEAEKALIERITGQLAENKPILAADIERLIDLAGPEVDQLLVQLAQAEKREMRLALARLCQQRLYGPPVVQVLAQLTKGDKEATVRSAATRALGVAAGWNNAAARDALIAVATDEAGKIMDRLLAAGQLGLVATMQHDCSNQDKTLFDALRSLLTDKNNPMRAVAQAGLDGKLVAKGEEVLPKR